MNGGMKKNSGFPSGWPEKYAVLRDATAPMF